MSAAPAVEVQRYEEAVRDGLLVQLRAAQEWISLDKKHVYRVRGKYAPGVTTVIKGVLAAPALERWKLKRQAEGTARAAYQSPPLEFEPMEQYMLRLRRLAEQQFEADRLADEAANVGSQVHQLIEHEIRRLLGQPSEAPVAGDEAHFRFGGWAEWAKSVDLRPLGTEFRVYHEGADYAGTVDCLALMNGRLTVADWKPTPTLYPERRMQLAAYRMALRSMGWPLADGAVVCLPREGGDVSVTDADTCDRCGGDGLDPEPEQDEDGRVLRDEWGRIPECRRCKRAGRTSADAAEAAFEAFSACLAVFRWQAALRRSA